VNIAFVGCGYVGDYTRHLPITARSTRRGVDRDSQRLTQFTKHWKVRAAKSLEAVRATRPSGSS